MPVVDYLSVLRGPSSSCVFLRGFLFLAFVDNSQWFQASPAPALPGGSFESETGFVSVTRTDGPPSTTTGAKMLLHFCPVGVTLSWEEAPPGSAGVPPAQSLPQLQPSPPPESTGSGALPLLRPGPCGSRRQGGRLQHRRETERQPKGQHAGGTPALPGVSSRW